MPDTEPTPIREAKPPLDQARWALEQFDQLTNINDVVSAMASGVSLRELQHTYLAAAKAHALVAIAEGLDSVARSLELIAHPPAELVVSEDLSLGDKQHFARLVEALDDDTRR